MSKNRAGLRQEDHDPQHLRKVLDAAKRNELASFIQAAFGIVNPGVDAVKDLQRSMDRQGKILIGLTLAILLLTILGVALQLR